MTYSSKFLVVLTLLLKILLVSTQYDADNFSLLIAGGYRPRVHTLVKHIVSIQQINESPSYFDLSWSFGCGHFCGASILTSRIILTAAHCVLDVKAGKIIDRRNIQIVAKTPNRLKKSQQTEMIDVKKIIVHPSFHEKKIRNDVALMELTSDIGEDGVHAQRIELTDGPVMSGKKCTAVGWGRLFHGGPLAADALYIDVNILSSSICERLYRNYAKGMLCVGDLRDLEKNVCPGDSGGPLICDGKVTGIVSFGGGIGNVPSVYSDVWYYRDWIARSGKEVHRINILKVLLLPLLVWIVSKKINKN